MKVEPGKVELFYNDSVNHALHMVTFKMDSSHVLEDKFEVAPPQCPQQKRNNEVYRHVLRFKDTSNKYPVYPVYERHFQFSSRFVILGVPSFTLFSL